MPGQDSIAPIPPQASTGAAAIDLIILAVTLNAVVFTAIIVFAIIYLVVKYRRGSKVDRSNPIIEHLPLELTWTIIPGVIAMGLFVWATAVFLQNRRPTAGALEILVVGKQWMWKMQHPNGRWENNELHLPAGRPIRLTMTSEDVIHSFFVPAFRIHQDVIPGHYTYMHVTPTRPGRYHLFCAQFCGTLHSQMTGVVTVMEPAAYEEWLRTGKSTEGMAAAGERLFIKWGCNGCHAGTGSVRAPSLEGIFGKSIPIQIPPPGVDVAKNPDVLKRVTATIIPVDRRYIHDSILLPDREIAAGYLPVMPSFKGQISEAEILQITAYIESLARTTTPSGGRVRELQSRELSPEEVRARTGFTPTGARR